MTINERIKELRKDQRLSQKDFAAKLGISQRSVSWSEQPENNVPDSTIKSLCMAFNTNENWLRNGIEPMYIQSPTFSLDDYVRQHGGTDFEIETMKAYFEIDPSVRKMLVQHFQSRLTASHADASSTNVEDAEAAYIKSRSKTAPKTTNSALNITADMGSKNSHAQ